MAACLLVAVVVVVTAASIRASMYQALFTHIVVLILRQLCKTLGIFLDQGCGIFLDQE